MARPAILISKQEIDKRVGTADSFRWSIGLPVPVESQEAETVLEDGMLTITLPEQPRGRQTTHAEAQSSCEDSA